METREITKSKTERPALFEKDNLLNRFFDFPLMGNFNFGAVLNVPSMNIKETDHYYKLSVAAPGLDKEDFDVQINKGILSISAEKEQNTHVDNKYNKREYNYSSWSRSFSLPDDAVADDISAEYKNGELKLDIPRNGDRKKRPGTKINIS